MKNVVYILLAFFCHCSPSQPLIHTGQETVLIEIECRNEQSVLNTVLQALRQVRFSDLDREASGDVLFLKARYKDLPNIKMLKVEQELRFISGVRDIQLTWDGMPARNNN